MGGQVRVSGGMVPVLIGWDMASAISIGKELGLPGPLIADILPAIEDRAIRAMRSGESDD